MLAYVRAFRAIEVAIAAGAILAVWSLINSGIFGTAVSDFSMWWADNVHGIFAVEVIDISEGAPGPGTTPDRVDFTEPIPILDSTATAAPTASPAAEPAS